ncbi:MAG: hypothetical protein OHK0013_40340 [Sandaracinaceae bacterium]
MTCLRGAVRLASILAVVLVALVTASASAQEDREAARAEFDQGRRSFEAGAFREALEHFQEAYRLAPHPNVRVNIANCYDQLDRPVEALFHFEHFLSEADRPPPAQRREVESAIARLRERVGTIALQVTPDGAQITIDGTETRRAPVAEPVRVTAGPHTVEIQLDGYVTERQTVVVQGGGSARVAIRLRRQDAVASTGTTGATTTTSGTAGTGATGTGATTTTGVTTGTPSVGTGTATASTFGTDAGTAPDTETGTQSGASTDASTDAGTDAGTGTGSGADSGTGSRLRIGTPTIIAGAVTGAALVGALIFGPLALSANGSFEDAVRRSNDPSLSAEERTQAVASGQGAASDARAFAAVTDVMLVTAAVGAGATVALFVMDQTSGDDEGGDARTATLVPVVGPGMMGLVATGTF